MKKILALLLAITMIAAFCACAKAPADTTPADTSADAPADTASDAPAASDGVAGGSWQQFKVTPSNPEMGDTNEHTLVISAEPSVMGMAMTSSSFMVWRVDLASPPPCRRIWLDLPNWMRR